MKNTNKCLQWLQGSNTLEVNSATGWEIVKEILDNFEIWCPEEKWLDVLHLAKINDRNFSFDGKTIYLEIQPGKGLSWYTDKQESIDWYGDIPFTIKDIIR